MKNTKFKRSVVSLLSLIALLFSFTACGKPITDSNSNGNGNSETDSKKTVLAVGNFDGGLGEEWLKVIEKNFEETYKDVEFEEGKRGVDVVITSKKDVFKGANLLTQMNYYAQDVWFLFDPNYYAFVSANLLYDMTDCVTDKVYDEDGELASLTGKPAKSSIVDKMWDGWSEFFNVGTSDSPQYYGLPFYQAATGIIYDADLFDEEKLYYKADGTIGANAGDVAAENCGKGPDGVLGTSDDGLPATWTQFLGLMDKMVTKGITPFVWSDQYTYQRVSAFEAIYASYEGYDNYRLNYTFDGFDTGLNMQITETNGYELLNQEGKTAAIKAGYDIVSKDAYYTTGGSHTDAQYTFINSVATNKRIAMLMEGGWWESESRNTFDIMSLTNPEWGYGKRNFKYMPIPVFSDTQGVKPQTSTQRTIYTSGADSLTCISKITQKYDLAKLFVQYVHANGAMQIFTQNTSCLKAFNITWDDAAKSKATKFVQSQLDLLDDGVKVVHDKVTSKLRLNNLSYFDKWQVGSTYGTEPTSAFLDKKNLTVEQYLQGCKNLHLQTNKWPA